MLKNQWDGQCLEIRTTTEVDMFLTGRMQGFELILGQDQVALAGAEVGLCLCFEVLIQLFLNVVNITVAINYTK